MASFNLEEMIRKIDVLKYFENECYQKNKLILDDVFQTLTPIEDKFIRLLIGTDEGISSSLDELCKTFQATPTRIEQMLASVVRKLRHPSRMKKLESIK